LGSVIRVSGSYSPSLKVVRRSIRAGSGRYSGGAGGWAKAGENGARLSTARIRKKRAGVKKAPAFVSAQRA